MFESHPIVSLDGPVPDWIGYGSGPVRDVPVLHDVSRGPVVHGVSCKMAKPNACIQPQALALLDVQIPISGIGSATKPHPWSGSFSSSRNHHENTVAHCDVPGASLRTPPRQ